VVKRIIVAIGSVIVLIACSVTLGGAAWSAADSSSTPVITFNDAAQQVTLTIPTPACPTSQPDCQWKFFLNEPKLSVDVATVFGTSGVLTLDYPKDFCGVIQADAYVGPPWVAKRGFQHTIEDCTTPTTTTTTTEPPTTTTTTTAPPTTTTTTAVPPVPPPTSGSNIQPPTPPAPTALPFTAPVTTSTVAAPLTQLPFTGKNIKPILFAGLVLVVLGLALLAPSRYWRRAARAGSVVGSRAARWLSGTWIGRIAVTMRLGGAAPMVGCSFYGL
jgi:hypothetical protein